jgi:hypothetical protein
VSEPVYRILYEGERWFGSNASSCQWALRRLGHSVLDVDVNTVVPLWESFSLKAARRLLRFLTMKEHNDYLLFLAREFKPHIFLAFKGDRIVPGTIQAMRAQGIATYNYYPDVSAFSHQAGWLPSTLQQYDCVFSTKSFLAADLESQGYPVQHWEYLPHGYDPRAHHPVAVTAEDQARYGADVTFIGGQTPAKERLLSVLLDRAPNLNLAVWGDRWQRTKSPALRACLRHRHIFGIEYMKAIGASRIVLGLLSEKQIGSRVGDQVTSRSFNIPACGAFMLHERTDEILRYYVEGREIECFGSLPELAEKIQYYLSHPEQRQAVAQAGYRRCVPAYSHDERIRSLIEWHRRHCKP